MKKYVYSWGEPHCIREVLQRMYPIAKLQRPEELRYSTDEGEQQLIDLIWQYILDTTGNVYNHIFITPGCVPAVNTSMRVLAKYLNTNLVSVHRDSFYYYSNMIEQNGYTCLFDTDPKSIGISDSPTNPDGQYCSIAETSRNIWDSVYYSDVFINGFHMPPSHVINCGSVSKTLGLTGLRIGYIATNDAILAERIRSQVKYEYCTVSLLAQTYLIDILSTIDIDRFMIGARGSINNNREELQKLSYLLNGDVQKDGMFYCGYADKSAKVLLNSAMVEWTDLPSGRIRLSLAQNNELTKEMVKTVLKIDGK